MNLMLTLSRGLGLASLYITHDLAVARAMSSRIAVMYLGAIVRKGPPKRSSRDLRIPTRLLVAAVPSPARRGDVTASAFTAKPPR